MSKNRAVGDDDDVFLYAEVEHCAPAPRDTRGEFDRTAARTIEFVEAVRYGKRAVQPSR
ncbi:hypothetical protein [Mycolicibacterium austroafricanum]|uniref:hypothetical protein n=1 Tax=Mycolicibacterium austroafricanum TaxID=39687 RepID=UPI000B01A086|nr:hypothetical protein [Mycolicibacterium austroafricanum]